MANQTYRNMVSSNIDNAIRLAQLASDVNHPVIKGDIREIALKHIFRPLLTNVVDIGTGKIIDHKGTESDQIDVIIYSNVINPPILYDLENSDLGLFPSETSLYAIEVKSVASATTIKEAIENLKKIWNLEYVSGIYDKFGNAIQHSLSLIVPTFFAFDSDLSGNGKSELDRYFELDPNAKTKPIIRVICVIGKGYWYFNEIDSAWYYWASTHDHDEVMSFLGGIINTYHDSIASRGRPRFGQYIIAREGQKVNYPS